MPNFKHRTQTLRQIIASVAKSEHEDGFCLYSGADELELDGLYYVSDYPSVKDDRDVYPDDVASGFWLVYYGDLFEDVIRLALEQKPNAGEEEILLALKHYDEFDDFLDLL